MGQRTDAKIRAFREAVSRGEASYKPVTGRRLKLLERMKDDAKGLVECIDLEISGERDGSGQWHYGDPIGGIISNLRKLEQLDLQAWKDERDGVSQSEGVEGVDNEEDRQPF